MIEYQIKDKDNLVFGRFATEKDRNHALRFCFGFPCEKEV